VQLFLAQLHRRRGTRAPVSPSHLAGIGASGITALMVLQIFASAAIGSPPTLATTIGQNWNGQSNLGASGVGQSTTDVAASGSNSGNLSGIWQYSGLVFNLSESSSGSLSSMVLHETCSGGNRTSFLTGSVATNATLSGTFTACTAKNNTLDINCNLPSIWTTPFTANVTLNQINGSYQGQYWNWTVLPNGNWTNCHIQSYFNVTFTVTRLNCVLMSLGQLATQYVPAATRAADLALTNQLVNGTKVVWSAAQSVPGGFKSIVMAFRNDLSHVWNIQANITSAYRPISYQAHFWDIQRCAMQMYQTVKSTPAYGTYLSGYVAGMNNLVLSTFGPSNTVTYTAGNLTFKLSKAVCGPPFTECTHTNGLAVDMNIEPVSSIGTADAIGALFGLCRPIPVKDPVHWEYINASPWGSPKCSLAGANPGNGSYDIDVEANETPSNDSPLVAAASGVGETNSSVNLLVTSPSGQQIGFNASTNSTVDDFGPGMASYSGAGTEPQVIDIAGNSTEPGNYSISGIGNGTGAYTISYEVIDADDTAVGEDGAILSAASQNGTARPGDPITPVKFPLEYDYAPASPWITGTATNSGSGSTTYIVTTPNGTFDLSASSATVDGLMYSPTGQVIALRPVGVAGDTSVTFPSALLVGPYTVEANGSILASSTVNATSDSTISFQMPTNDTVVTIDGFIPVSGAPASPSPFPWLLLLAIGVVVAAIVAVGVAVVLRRRRARPPPLMPFAPPPFMPLPPPPPPPT
jgi:hypothetical protein